MQKTKHRQLTVYGPDPLEKGEDGHFRYTMADIFPRWQAMIVGVGLHVTLALEFMEALAAESGETLGPELEDQVYEDLVAVVMRGEHVVIRSMPDRMECCFRAAELLEEAVPAEIIRFTGSRDPLVREAFKLRGESWKMTPRYFTVEEIISQIRLAMVSVGTANRYYYNMESGGRMITYEQFEAIRGVLTDRREFSARLCEVLDLYGRRNKQYVRELDFFMADQDVLEISRLEKLVECVTDCQRWAEVEKRKAWEMFEACLVNLRQAIAPAFQRDDPQNPTWRTYMYSMLNDIPPTEESMLGVSDEFNMNIRWLPGCRIEEGRVLPDPHADESTASLIQDFFRFYGPLEYINLGQVMRSQSQKRAAGSYREVYIATLKLQGAELEQIRILRKVRRGTLYWLNRGYSQERAAVMCEGYLQYTFDRRDLLSMLGANTPPVNCLKREDNIPGLGFIPVEFFNRPYIDGLATDKVSFYYYENESFVRTQAELLGTAAALNLIIGRVDPDTGMVYFGDGDELLVFGQDKFIPVDIVLGDYTGAFTDVISPLERFAPFYVNYVTDMLARIRVPGWKRAEILEVGDAFVASMRERIDLIRQMLLSGESVRSRIEAMIADRDPELNPVRIKWSKALERLQKVPLEDFMRRFREDVHQQIARHQH
ncbi:hypothetical protein LLH00_14160 [bacterium]|nr:hypothetical protein [bacterium]